MFPLFSNRLPTNADDLAQVLERGLSQLFDAEGKMVAVVDKSFPALAELRINLDGARLRPDALRPSAISGETTPAFQVDNFELSASDISVEDIRLDLSMHAVNARLHQGRDRDQKLVLALHAADAGRIEVSVAQADLEKLIATLAKRETEKQGVAIEDLKLSLRPAGLRGVDVAVEIRARKLFLRGVIRISAKLEVDEQLSAQLSGLSCTGDGAIGSMASNFLRPYLDRVEGRRLNLAALPLGEISLRDIQITIGERVSIAAHFGGAT